MIAKMASRGMNVARLNFSHGNHRQHQGMIDLVRRVNEKRGFKVSLLQDLEGYRIRLGQFKKSVALKRNQTVYLSCEGEFGDDHIPFDFMGD